MVLNRSSTDFDLCQIIILTLNLTVYKYFNENYLTYNVVDKLLIVSRMYKIGYQYIYTV